MARPARCFFDCGNAEDANRRFFRGGNSCRRRTTCRRRIPQLIPPTEFTTGSEITASQFATRGTARRPDAVSVAIEVPRRSAKSFHHGLSMNSRKYFTPPIAAISSLADVFSIVVAPVVRQFEVPISRHPDFPHRLRTAFSSANIRRNFNRTRWHNGCDMKVAPRGFVEQREVGSL